MRLKLPTTTISGIILLLVGVSTTACHPRPDVTASSREEAMERCLNDVGKEFEKVKEERARAKADQSQLRLKQMRISMTSISTPSYLIVSSGVFC